MSNTTFSTTNYLVPASGTTHAVQTQGVASAQIFYGDFRDVDFSGLSFLPQGAYFDNSLGTAPLIVTILPIGYTLTIPAGSISQSQFPAPSGFSYTLTGSGAYTITWVDYPLFPSGQNVSISGGTVNANITNPALDVDATAIPRDGSAYQTQLLDKPLIYLNGKISGATKTLTLSPPAGNSYELNSLSLFLSGDSTIVTAGEVLITIGDGLNIFSQCTIYLSNIIQTSLGCGQEIFEVNFGDGLGIISSQIVITLSVALSGGSLSCNCFMK